MVRVRNRAVEMNPGTKIPIAPEIAILVQRNGLPLEGACVSQCSRKQMPISTET